MRERLKPLYDANKGKYKNLKEALIEDLDAMIKPMREKRAEFAKDENKIHTILKAGARQAKKVADKKLLQVKKAIGVI